MDDRVTVVIDNELSSKAIAGTTRIRIRGSAVFADLDFDQLLFRTIVIKTAIATLGFALIAGWARTAF